MDGQNQPDIVLELTWDSDTVRAARVALVQEETEKIDTQGVRRSPPVYIGFGSMAGKDPAAIPQKKLTGDGKIRQKATAVGEEICAEDGVAAADLHGIGRTETGDGASIISAHKPQ